MMKPYHNIEKQIEDTLNSINGIERATPAPYLLTRINQQRNKVDTSWLESLTRFLTKPAIAVLVLFFIIMINVLIITSGNENSIDVYDELTEYTVSGSPSVNDLDNIIP